MPSIFEYRIAAARSTKSRKQAVQVPTLSTAAQHHTAFVASAATPDGNAATSERTAGRKGNATVGRLVRSSPANVQEVALAHIVLSASSNLEQRISQMRTQLLLSLTCVLGAVACGSSSTNQQAANDPSTVQSTTTTGAAVNAPIVTADSDTNESNLAVHSNPPAMNNGVVSNVGANQNFSGSTPQVATGNGSAQLGATPIVPSSAPGMTGSDTAPAASASGHAALTPMNQGNSKSETQITADIRKTVMADKSLSFTAKNVKIITQGTKVTLRGAVKSDAEKSSIENEARNTAGVTDVDDQIIVKP